MKTEEKEAQAQKNYEEALAVIEKHFHPDEKILHTEQVTNGAKSGGDKATAAMMAVPFIAIAGIMAIFFAVVNSVAGRIAIGLVIAAMLSVYVIGFLYPLLAKEKRVAKLVFTNFAVYLIFTAKRAPIEFLYYKDIDKRLKIAAYSIRFIFEPRDESESKQLAKRYSELLKEIKSGKHTDELPMTQMRHMAVIQRTSRGAKIQVLYMMRAFAIENGEQLTKKIFEIEKSAHAAGREFPIVSPPDNMILPD